jgi:hypothetical protein
MRHSRRPNQQKLQEDRMDGLAWGGNPGLLRRRMALLDIDPDELKGADPLLYYDLQGRCSLCRDKQRCVAELAQPACQDWKSYCVNGTMLVALGAQRSGCLEAPE